MGARITLLLGLASLIVIAGCSQRTPLPTVDKAKVILPDSEIASSSSQIGADATDLSQALRAPKVAIPSNDNLLQVLNVNLDVDQMDEQILVLKNRDNPDSSVSIGVVDFDTTRNQYILSWQHATLATNIRTFTVTTEDIVGDHNLEIICRGIDDKGEQTLDVFRRTPPPAGNALYYSEIFDRAVKGTIEIDRHDRSQAYKLGQQNGTSFSIVTYSQDPESQHIGDLVKRTFDWRFQSGSYVESDVEKIPGKQIEDQRLSDLYASGADAFETFLSGSWYRASADTSPAAHAAGASPTDSSSAQSTTILYFDPTSHEVSFYGGDVMEIYRWENSYRTLFNSLVISGYNELVQYIRAQISVAVVSLNEIVVYAPDEWAGTYMKLTKGMQQSLVRRNQAPFVEPQLSGEYVGDTGDRLDFNGTRFTQKDKRGTLSGGFSMFRFGQPIIELIYMKSDGIVTDTKTYGYEYQEEKSPTRVVHTLTLTRGVLGIHGFAPTGDEPVRYVQIENLTQGH